MDCFDRCERYYRYPAYVATLQRIIIGGEYPSCVLRRMHADVQVAIFILRMYCIYGRCLKVAALIAVFLVTEVVVKLVRVTLLFYLYVRLMHHRSQYAAFAWGQPITQAPITPQYVACVLSVSEAKCEQLLSHHEAR